MNLIRNYVRETIDKLMAGRAGRTQLVYRSIRHTWYQRNVPPRSRRPARRMNKT